MVVPKVEAKEAVTTQMLRYLEWEQKAFKDGPLLNLLRPLTLALLTPGFSAADGLCQTGLFTAKVLVLATGKTVQLLTRGTYGKFSQTITYQSLLDHAQKAGMYFVIATASAVSGIAALIFTAAFCIQLTMSVVITIRVATVALLALSVMAAVWVHHPTRMVPFYYKYQLAAEKTYWERAKEFIDEHRPRKQDIFKIAKASAPAVAAATAYYLYRKYL